MDNSCAKGRPGEHRIDVRACLDRVNYCGETDPTREALAAHVRHIPFEDLDPLTGAAATATSTTI